MATVNLFPIILGFTIFVTRILPFRTQYISGGFTINNNQYSLRWEVFGPFVTFRAMAMSTGSIGFGLSPKGTTEGSDFFISGMYENGTVYAIDAHGGTEKDAMNNYMLLFFRRSHMFTEVHFRRALFTGDCKEDLRIMNEPQYVIWSFGPVDNALEQQGNVLVNLLNPPMFHSYYSTNGSMGMDNMAGCITPAGGESGGGSGGGGEKEEPAKPAEEAPAEKQDVEPDATLI